MKPRRYVCSDCGSDNIDWARCSHEDCDSLVFSRGWCKAHYNRWYRRHTGEVVDRNPYQELEGAPGFWERVDACAAERRSVRLRAS